MAEYGITKNVLSNSLKTELESLSKVPNGYEWTTTAGQVTFTLPTNSNYNPNSQWMEVSIGGATVSPSLIQKDSSTQFTILVDTAKIPSGLKVVAKWVEPHIPATTGHKTTHELGGYDEIDITKLLGYQTNVADKIAQMARKVTPPTTATSTGTTGDWAADASYFYICHATNQWSRIAVSTW